MQQVADEFVFADQIGTLAIKPGNQVNFPNLGFHGGGAFAVQFQSGHHLLA
jgi:hypothetical protein